ncbi:Inducer of phenazine A [Actinoplanes sp. NPDC051411]|uniref:SGNH/GDSL hydrolase family protein n=1 Tax=Actinoplanes sp. NPDC051411 TaxID=3155522 RepID=UPI0034215FD3
MAQSTKMPVRRSLLPYMAEYEEKFADDGDVRWLPYLMYFHPREHRSPVVNTDGYGFRYAYAGDRRISAGDLAGADRVRVLAGSSTVFGIGAGRDEATLASRLNAYDERGGPWLNFGGRSFNSTQEFQLYALYSHLLPRVEEIVLFSGFNNLGLARLPETVRGDHGAFFMCNQFFDALGATSARGRRRTRRREDDAPTPLEVQLDYAVDLTGRHLRLWKALADQGGSRLTYVLQPLANWVRSEPCPQESEVFAELDTFGDFGAAYGDILTPEVQKEYAARVGQEAARLGVPFIDLTPALASWIAPDDWIFVDRIHFTDHGHDVVARNLLPLLTERPEAQ